MSQDNKRRINEISKVSVSLCAVQLPFGLIQDDKDETFNFDRKKRYLNIKLIIY